MDLSIIIVSWNVKDKLRDNLRALFASQNADFEVTVIDNHSGDGSAEMVRQEYPQVKLIANRENLGFAKANNQGLKSANGDYVLLLNPDMRVFDDTLSNMVAWMNCHPEAAVAGCRLVDSSGQLVRHVRRFPALFDQLAIILKIPHVWPGSLNKYLRNDFNYDKAARVDTVRGGFFMIRSTCLKTVGQLDENYFLWFEEVDYCRRVKSAGLQVWYTSAAECIDLVGQSFKQLKRDQAQKYFRDSMLKYFKKWHSPPEYWLLKLAWPLGLLITRAGEAMKIKNKAKT